MRSGPPSWPHLVRQVQCRYQSLLLIDQVKVDMYRYLDQLIDLLLFVLVLMPLLVELGYLLGLLRVDIRTLKVSGYNLT